MKWRLIQSGHLDGYTNMAIDEAMFNLRIAKGVSDDTPPTLRLYGWSPPAISIGYFQEIEGIKLEKKIDIVRRLTGGRAILHDQELTFCLVVSLNDSIILEDVSASYNIICRAIIEGLQGLGIDAQIRGDGTSVGSQLGKEKNRTVSRKIEPFFCFDHPSKYDIIYKGKKLVGSAQRRKKGVVLHHGSILLDSQNLEGSTSINSILGRKISFEELSQNIIHGFEKELLIKLITGSLTEDELKLSQELVIAKYNRQQYQ